MLNKYQSYSSFDINQLFRSDYKSTRKLNRPGNLRNPLVLFQLIPPFTKTCFATDSSVLSNESGIGSLHPSYSTKLLNTTYNSTNHIDIPSTTKEVAHDLTTVSPISNADQSKYKGSSIETQYQKQFERVAAKKTDTDRSSFSKLFYNPLGRVSYRCIQRPPVVQNMYDFVDEANDLDKNSKEGNISSDDDSIKSVYSDSQSIKTEEFSNVFNKYVALTNIHLGTHDIQYT
jgi:hypothetical protein